MVTLNSNDIPVFSLLFWCLEFLSLGEMSAQQATVCYWIEQNQIIMYLESAQVSCSLHCDAEYQCCVLVLMRQLITVASSAHVGAPSCGRKEQQLCQGWRRFFRSGDSAHQTIFPWSQTENTVWGKPCHFGNGLKIKCHIGLWNGKDKNTHAILETNSFASPCRHVVIKCCTQCMENGRDRWEKKE